METAPPSSDEAFLFLTEEEYARWGVPRVRDTNTSTSGVPPYVAAASAARREAERAAAQAPPPPREPKRAAAGATAGEVERTTKRGRSAVSPRALPASPPRSTFGASLGDGGEAAPRVRHRPLVRPRGGGEVSSLSWEEHAFFDANARFKRGVLDEETGTKLEELRGRVARDRERFDQSHIALAQANKERYTHYDVGVRTSLETELDRRRRRVCATYPQLFRFRAELALRPTFERGAALPRSMTSLVQIAGAQPAVFDMTVGRTIPESFSVDVFAAEPPHASKVAALELHVDAACAELAVKEHAEVCLASSAFAALLGTSAQSDSQSWELPVQVKAVKAVDGHPGRVAFVDKPLLKREMHLREKNRLFYKRAFLKEGLTPSDARGGQVQYSKGRLGNVTYVVRSRVHVCVRDSTRAKGNAPVVVRSKMQYMPDYGRELLTPEERVAWWAALAVRPDAEVLVGHVDVTESTLIGIERLDRIALLEDSDEAVKQVKAGCSLLQDALALLRELPPGSYMLTHSGGHHAIACYEECTKDDPASALGVTQTLPLGPPAAGGSRLQTYDLHKSHASSGATDDDAFPFVPFAWEPAVPGVPQVSRTFRPAGNPSGVHMSPWNAHQTRELIEKNGLSIPSFCFSFFDTGACKRMGAGCPFKHWTYPQVKAEMDAALLADQQRDILVDDD